MVGLGIITGGSGLMTFVDIPSVLIVVLGSYFGLFTFGTMADGLGVFKIIGLCFKVPNFNERGVINYVMFVWVEVGRELVVAVVGEV
jgi:chemotaxis protein MotA